MSYAIFTVKFGLVGDLNRRRTTIDKADFKSKVVSAMRSLQKNSKKIAAFFQKPSLQYAA
jgi:hypothetical protein